MKEVEEEEEGGRARRPGPTRTLRDGRRMPVLGYGTWRVRKTAVAALVEAAVREEGYRHIDCAALYRNERQVGIALARLLRPSPSSFSGPSPRATSPVHGAADGHRHEEDGAVAKMARRNKERSGDADRALLKREDLFITSKLWNSHHRRELVLKACLKSIQDLQVDYLDLYLMHWPVAMKPDSRPPLRKGAYLKDEYIDTSTSLAETWSAMEDLVDRGIVKSIGVSNFTINQLQEIFSFARIRPVVNQIEMHPYLLQPDLLHFCRDHNIIVTAYSPLGQAKDLLTDKTVVDVAQRIGRTPAQVVLRWGIEHGAVIIPRTERRDHLRQNADIFSFELDADAVAALDTLHVTQPRRYMRGWVRDQWD